MRFILLALTVLTAIAAQGARAQDSSVEVNLEALGGYAPPPMFEEKAPSPAPAPATLAPKKAENQKSKHKTSIPIPPRRPALTHAAQSFIERARAEYRAEKAALPPGATSPAAPEKSAGDPAVIKDNELEAELLSPSAQDVLASIEGKKAEDNNKGAPTSQTLESINDGDIRVLAGAGQESLEGAVAGQVLAISRQRLAAGGVDRIEIRSYASAVDKVASSARRISLARAISARDALISGGIDSAMIDIRPLGDQSGGRAPDRLDLLFVPAGQ